MGLSPITIDELRERVDILDVIGGYVRLQRAGNEYRGLCPFHDEKTPSFYVNAEKGLWICRGACGTGGDVFDFVQKAERVDFRGACELLAQQLGRTLATSPGEQRRQDQRERLYAICELAAKLYRQALWHSSGGAIARDYLAERGVSEETARRFGLGYAPAGWDRLVGYLERHGHSLTDAEAAGIVKRREQGKGYYDAFRHRLIFPILDHRRRTVGFGGRVLDPEEEPKYLNSAESPIFSKREVLYGLPFATDSLADGAIVVEGYMDVIALHQHGITAALATLGTALSIEHLRRLRRYTQRVVLCYDADTAGRRATDRAAVAFIEEGMDGRVLTLPAGQDPDEFVRGAGRAAFEQRLAEAPDLLEYRLQQVFETTRGDAASRAAAVSEAVVAILSDISDPVRQDDGVRRAAEWWAGRAVGLQEQFERTLTSALRARRRRARGRREQPETDRVPARPSRREQVERRVLQRLLHRPSRLTAKWAQGLGDLLGEPTCLRVYQALVALGPEASAAALSEQLDEPGRKLMADLLCETPDPQEAIEALVLELRCGVLEDQAEALRGERERLDPNDWEAQRELHGRLQAMEEQLDTYRRQLLELRSHPAGDLG